MDMWRGVETIQANMLDYATRVRLAALQIAYYLAPMMEEYAKDNAPWTDRTGNARQGLQGFVEDVSETIVDIYISHGMDYGKWLELAHAGRYAILWPTIQAHMPVITGMLEEVFR